MATRSWLEFCFVVCLFQSFRSREGFLLFPHNFGRHGPWDFWSLSMELLVEVETLGMAAAFCFSFSRRSCRGWQMLNNTFHMPVRRAIVVCRITHLLHVPRDFQKLIFHSIPHQKLQGGERPKILVSSIFALESPQTSHTSHSTNHSYSPKIIVRPAAHAALLIHVQSSPRVSSQAHQSNRRYHICKPPPRTVTENKGTPFVR